MLTPQKKVKDSKEELSKKEAITKLWEMAKGAELFIDVNQRKIFDDYYNNPNQLLVYAYSRQIGKCLKSTTYVATPTGPVMIKDLKVGDYVYGYNKDRTVSLTKVLNVFNQGIKTVVDLKHRHRVVASATKDHIWQTISSYNNSLEELTTEQVIKSSFRKIARKYIDDVGGDIHEPHAYSLGAMMGDGCCKQSTRKLYISSENSEIPKAVAKELGCVFYKNSGGNFTWCLSMEEKNTSHFGNSIPVLMNYYDDWCRDRYAHEKTCDINIIKTWTRDSQLRFLAGLIDTDGSISVVGRSDNELKIMLSMQAKGVIDAVKYLFLSLWQIELCYLIDDRKKYKNGPCHVLYLNNNFCAKRALKELSPHIVTDRKKYKPKYDNFPNYNHVPDYCGVIAGEEYETETYDIHVDNETNLYLLANGLVTHNSTGSLSLADQVCREKPNQIVTLVAPTQVQARKLAKTAMREILITCPPHLKPEYKAQENLFRYANGSEIEILGNNAGRIEGARGNKSHLIICDEVGFWDDLDYSLESVLYPRLNSTRGKMILISTPPKSASHPFYTIAEAAKLKNALTIRTIYDCPRYTEEDIERMAEVMGGLESNTFLREMMVLFIPDTEFAVIPEANDELLLSITGEWKRPPYFDTYVGCDWGSRDKTALTFAYWDFRNGKLIIEDEVVINGKDSRSDIIADKLTEKEMLLWGKQGEEYTPYSRVADLDLRLLNDLNDIHGITILPSNKDNKEAAINELRLMLAGAQIIINPKCKHLLFDLKNTTWNKTRTSFERSKLHGHGDSLDSLIFIVRNLHKSRNPYPHDFDLNLTANSFISPNYKPGTTQFKQGMIDIFTKNKRIR